MRLDKPRRCPKCGKPVFYLVEYMRARADFTCDEDGDWGGGEFTDRHDPYAVHAECRRGAGGCGHEWKIKGARQIWDVLK